MVAGWPRTTVEFPSSSAVLGRFSFFFLSLSLSLSLSLPNVCLKLLCSRSSARTCFSKQFVRFESWTRPWKRFFCSLLWSKATHFLFRKAKLRKVGSSNSAPCCENDFVIPAVPSWGVSLRLIWTWQIAPFFLCPFSPKQKGVVFDCRIFLLFFFSFAVFEKKLFFSFFFLFPPTN